MSARTQHEMDAELDVLEDIVDRAETLAEIAAARADVIALKAENQAELTAINVQLQTTGTAAWYRSATAARGYMARRDTRLAGLLSALAGKRRAITIQPEPTVGRLTEDRGGSDLSDLLLRVMGDVETALLASGATTSDYKRRDLMAWAVPLVATMEDWS